MTAPEPLASPQESPAFRMLDDMQRGFPLTPRPFHTLSQRYGLPVEDVMAAYREWLASGAISRIGGVFDQAAGGASLLAAIAVPAHDLERVADIVSRHPGVNHNYEREHAYNLWFVMAAPNADALKSGMRALDQATGYNALRLPMVKPYRIDLSFGLSGNTAQHDTARQARAPVATIANHERPLAALAEEGLAITEEPFHAWAKTLGLSVQEVLACIERWLDHGVLRRFGNVVRHHEFGFHANAMTVFDVADDRVDAVGEALARTPEVTLAYQRSRAPGWGYNLYCMIHGKDRDTVQAIINQLLDRHGLCGIPHAVLFSVRRFKQSGARRYRDHAHA